jgi:hypothetical protein
MCHEEPGYLSRYSNRLDGRGSFPGSGKIFLYTITSISSVGSTQASYPVGTEGCFPGDKAAGV